AQASPDRTQASNLDKPIRKCRRTVAPWWIRTQQSALSRVRSTDYTLLFAGRFPVEYDVGARFRGFSALAAISNLEATASASPSPIPGSLGSFCFSCNNGAK